MLVLVGVLLCQLLHLRFKVLHLLFNLFGCIGAVDVVREHRFPLIGYGIVLNPNVAHTDKVARMIEGEIKETLFYQLVSVTLHDSTFYH